MFKKTNTRQRKQKTAIYFSLIKIKVKCKEEQEYTNSTVQHSDTSDALK